MPLIEPYGIEIRFRKAVSLLRGPLIEPYGIEILSRAFSIYCSQFPLIEPYGIEIFDFRIL